jgi:hypothetical protein
MVLLAGLALLAATPAVGAECVTAEVDRPILLPDGSRHPAGLLTLCLSRDFSPVSSLHLAFVDRRPVGQWLSRHGKSEAPADTPLMVFAREADGALRLEGYAMPSGRGTKTYLVGAGRKPGGSAAGASRRAMRGGSPDRSVPGPTVLVAAHPRGR